jgi:hypothetical protein
MCAPTSTRAPAARAPSSARTSSPPAARRASARGARRRGRDSWVTGRPWSALGAGDRLPPCRPAALGTARDLLLGSRDRALRLKQLVRVCAEPPAVPRVIAVVRAVRVGSVLCHVPQLLSADFVRVRLPIRALVVVPPPAALFILPVVPARAFAHRLLVLCRPATMVVLHPQLLVDGAALRSARPSLDPGRLHSRQMPARRRSHAGQLTTVRPNSPIVVSSAPSQRPGPVRRWHRCACRSATVSADSRLARAYSRAYLRRRTCVVQGHPRPPTSGTE